MPLLRVFLLWALMLAVPFQGYAAASMLQCAAGVPAVATGAPAHGHADGHEGHHAHAAPDAPPADPHADHHAEPQHTCGTCGACHAVALVGAPLAPASAPLPRADLTEPARALANGLPRVLERPPRA